MSSSSTDIRMVLGKFFVELKALANEDTLLRTHCCRHKCFPVCPRAQHFSVADTNVVSGTKKKNVSDFVQKHFVSATNVSQFAQPKKHHGQQCVLVYQGLNAKALKPSQLREATKSSINLYFDESYRKRLSYTS